MAKVNKGVLASTIPVVKAAKSAGVTLGKPVASGTVKTDKAVIGKETTSVGTPAKVAGNPSGTVVKGNVRITDRAPGSGAVTYVGGNTDESSISSILKMAADAVKNLNGTLNTSPSASYEPYLTEPLDGIKVNNLDSYVTPQLRNDYIRDRATIQDALDRATNAAFDVQRAQAIQDSLKAEDTNYRNTLNAISEMRRNLIGSASSGANVGAANATALQALLGLGQQNTDLTTEGLRNITNVDRERTAQLAQNAADAITAANDATSRMYDAANSAYGSDRSYAAQGAAEALGNIRSTDITSRSNERMNDATNAINEAIAKIQAAAQEKVAKTEANAQKDVAKITGNTKTVTKTSGNKTTTTTKTTSTKKSTTKKGTTKKGTTKKGTTKKGTTKKGTTKKGNNKKGNNKK